MARADTARAFAEIRGTSADFRGPGADTTDPLIGTTPDGIRGFVLRRTVWEARRIGRPVELTTSGDQGEHRIIVTPEGQLSAADDSGETHAFIDLPDAAEPDADQLAVRRLAVAMSESAPVVAAARPSFIDSRSQPTPQGLVGTLVRLGAPVKPTAAHTQHLENTRAVSAHWAGCRVIAVANGKGGVGKTMTTAMLAAVFARNGGGSVLAWDNNDTRGTLGWRTETSAHDATVIDAAAAATQLLAAGASAADIAGYVHHQSEDRYDVLRSNPQLLAAKQRIGAREFDQLIQVAARYYRMVIFDSGNDESAHRWLRMIDSAHQLVIPTLAAPESAESAALLLEELIARDPHSAQLARDAVVIVTESERGAPRDVRDIAEAFRALVRAVALIPFDFALKRGPLRFDTLRPATRRAWIEAGAAIANGLK